MKITTAFVVILLTVAAHGQAIHTAFHNGPGTLGAMTSRPAGMIVDTTAVTWNNVSNSGGNGLDFSGFPLMLANGSASGALLAWVANGSQFNTNGWQTQNQDYVMMEGYYAFVTGNSITYTNLPASLTAPGYALTIYGDTTDARKMNYIVSDGTVTTTVTLDGAAGAFSGTFTAGQRVCHITGVSWIDADGHLRHCDERAGQQQVAGAGNHAGAATAGCRRNAHRLGDGILG